MLEKLLGTRRRVHALVMVVTVVCLLTGYLSEQFFEKSVFFFISFRLVSGLLLWKCTPHCVLHSIFKGSPMYYGGVLWSVHTCT